MPFALTEEELQKTEAELRARLPASYRQSMTTANGGDIELDGDVWQLFPIRDTSSRKLVSRTANHIIRETNTAREWERFPENALAIASNGTGDLLVLRRHGRQFGPEILVWRHEDGELEPAAGEFEQLKRV